MICDIVSLISHGAQAILRNFPGTLNVPGDTYIDIDLTKIKIPIKMTH